MAAKVMKKAWEIAKEGQKKFGGKVKEYFAQALRIAWAIVKGAMKMKKYTVNEHGVLVGLDYKSYKSMNENEKVELKSHFKYAGEGQWIANDATKHDLILSSNLMEMIERRISKDKERAFQVVARRIDSVALPELKEKAMELLRNTIENWEKNEQNRIDSIIEQMAEKFGIVATFKKKKEHGYNFETNDGEYVHVTYRDPYTEDGHVTVGFNDVGQVTII